MQRAAHAYLKTDLGTTSPGQIVVMLYDGAIKFLNQAKDQIIAKDFAGKGISINRAVDIINELDSSLNMEKGGDISTNLHKLYFWCIAKISMANLKMDVEAIDAVLQCLAGLRDAYAQILDKPEVQAVSVELTLQQQGRSTNEQRIVPQAATQPMPTMQNGLRGRNMYSKMACMG